MALTSAQLSEVAPPDCRQGVVYANRYILVCGTPWRGSTHKGRFAIMDASTGTAKLFSGRVRAGYGGPPVLRGDKAWIASSGNPSSGAGTTLGIDRIDMTTGSVVGWTDTTSPFEEPVCAVVGDQIWIWRGSTGPGSRIFDIPSSGFTGGPATPGVVSAAVPHGAWVYLWSGGTIYRVSQSTGLLDAGFATAYSVNASSAKEEQLIRRGSEIWGLSLNGYVWRYDLANPTVSPATWYVGSTGRSAGALGPDGMLYWLFGGTTGTSDNRVLIFDPDNFTWTTDTVVTSSAYRYGIYNAAGKLWIPSDLPLT